MSFYVPRFCLFVVPSLLSSRLLVDGAGYSLFSTLQEVGRGKGVGCSLLYSVVWVLLR